MYQKITVVGNLGRDPEMRYMPDGTAVTNLSVAVNRKYKDNKTGATVSQATWFKVSVWGAQAEPCNQYLSSGRPVLVEGELVADDYGNPRTWVNKDGDTRASFEIRANRVVFLGSGGGGNSGGSQPSGQPDADDDIPF